ncbi:MAG: heme ABC exporter ATP-binding protein CcmA [Actinomycetota bacterium]
MSSVVELRGAVVLLGRFPALSGADLRVDEGEVVLTHGPNGAGKTTLLTLLAGLHPLAGGAGTVLGVDLATERRALRTVVGLLGHRTHLYDDLTVLDNARFWAAAVGAEELDARRALERVEVEPRLADVAVERLSAGQRRRVALAMLVVRRPRLWLLDEPHAGLDESGRDLLDVLVREAAGAGATVVLSSHELDRAVALADRAVLVNGGTISPSTVGGRLDVA